MNEGFGKNTKALFFVYNKHKTLDIISIDIYNINRYDERRKI